MYYLTVMEIDGNVCKCNIKQTDKPPNRGDWCVLSGFDGNYIVGRVLAVLEKQDRLTENQCWAIDYTVYVKSNPQVFRCEHGTAITFNSSFTVLIWSSGWNVNKLMQENQIRERLQTVFVRDFIARAEKALAQ